MPDPGPVLRRLVTEYYHPWPNQAGVYVARADGRYADAGVELDVGVTDPGRGDALDHLARGEVDYAFVPTNRLMRRRELGLAVVGVCAIDQRPLESLFTTVDTGIRRARDLEGRRVGCVSASPRLQAMARALCAAQGGDPDLVEVVGTGVHEPLLGDVEAGRLDACIGGPYAWEPLLGPTPPSRRVVLRIDDEGGPTYHGYVLATRGTTCDERPDEVRGVVAATVGGYRDARADPDRAAATMRAVIPYFPPDLVDASTRLVADAWETEDGPIGVQRRALIEPYARWLHERELLASADSWRGALTNAFLPSPTEEDLDDR